MGRKPKESHLAYKEWAPSIKLLQQNINLELYIQKAMAELQ